MLKHRAIVRKRLLPQLPAAASLLLALAGPVHAGIVDSPTPDLGGQKSLHLWSASGVITAAGLGTIFSCTNPLTTPVYVSVELFVDSGGAPCNDASAAAVSVPAGGTVVFATQNSADSSFISAHALSPTPMYLSGGSARVVSTGKGVLCSAFVADVYNSPPMSMTPIVLVARGKQRGG
jgi:hypothetical protein